MKRDLMQGIKLVSFDATNTLLKFKVPPWQYYSIVGRKYGYTGTEDILKAQMKNSFKIMEKKHPNFGKNDVTWKYWWKEIVKGTYLGQLPANVNIESIADQLIDEFRTTKCWVVADGSQKILNFLKQKEICIGVISNFDPRIIDILCNTGLYNNFDFVLSSYEVGYSKPDKRIFERAIRACKETVQPSECLHIGDDLEKDYKGAQEAGWRAVLVTPTITEEVTRSTKRVFRSLDDLYVALQQNKIKL